MIFPVLRQTAMEVRRTWTLEVLWDADIHKRRTRTVRRFGVCSVGTRSRRTVDGVKKIHYCLLAEDVG